MRVALQKSGRRTTFWCLFLLVVGGCQEFPRDPDNTTGKILQSRLLKAGVIHSPPWAAVQGTEPSGIEVELIRGFADGLGAAVEWQALPVDAGFEKLGKGEIHVLIGGLKQTSPYRAHAGFTRPYLVVGTGEENLLGLEKKDRHVMAIRRGENRFLILLESFLEREAGALRQNLPETGA